VPHLPDLCCGCLVRPTAAQGRTNERKRKPARKPLATEAERCKSHSSKLIRKTLHPVILPDGKGMTQKTTHCNGVMIFESNARVLRNNDCNVFVLNPVAPGGKPVNL